MSYDHITRDVGRKLSEDVGAACRRNMVLMPDRDAAFMVAMFGASTAIAYAAAAFTAAHPELDKVAVVRGLWEMMEPMVLKNIQDLPA